MKRIAIDGFCCIGRASLRLIGETANLEIVTVNDLMTIDNAAYFLQYDSVYGKYEHTVSVQESRLHISDKAVLFFTESDPTKLPWKNLKIDLVIESTGLFTRGKDAEKHLLAGSGQVLMSGPTKSSGTPTVVYGVNIEEGNTQVFSCGSCTTNNIRTIIEILGRRLGIKKAILNTVHAFTASQKLVDAPSKREWRMGRSAAINLSPATTGAAITKALPAYEGKFDGVVVRTPVATGSLSDVTFIAARPTTPEEINQIFLKEAATDRYRDVVTVTNDPLVSQDVIKSSFATIIDAARTRVVDGDLVKVMAWYDNGCGFVNQMMRQILALR